MSEKNLNRIRIVGVRFTPQEYEKMEQRFKATTCRKMSEYLRKCLFNKPITANYRNASLDEFMIEIIRLRNELKAVGNNFNQLVKKMHTLGNIPEFKNWIVSCEVEKIQLLDKVAQINSYVELIARKWLLS